MADTPVPLDVTHNVEEYIRSELHDAERFSNRAPLDESGIFSLHRLAGKVYADGFAAGVAVQSERARMEARRRRDQLEASAAAASDA